MEKKYEMTDETIEVGGKTLHRIRALRDFGRVKKGDVGGFIEKEDNLSHDGNCWVGDDAKVYGYAKVFGDAHVYGYAEVYGNSRIYGKAEVFDEPCIYGHAEVYGEAYIYDRARVYGNAHVYGHAKIYGDACVCWDDWINDDRRISTKEKNR
ncbi:hypothetical protein [Bartonella sp. OC16QHHD]|uniref:hypothetical protein n=1 Tax=Bartonella sp. OC16QHHD TaxID=3243562 RepID=UPI0035CFEA2B